MRSVIRLGLLLVGVISLLGQEAGPAAGEPFGWKAGAKRPVLPADGSELAVEKVIVGEGRYVKGLLMTPLDGNVYSQDYAGRWYETTRGGVHGTPANYDYIHDPGYHVRFLFPSDFNYLAIRGGFRGAAYANVKTDDGPGDSTKVFDFDSFQPPRPEELADDVWRQRLWTEGFGCRRFDQPVRTGDLTFFWRGDSSGALADMSFFRLGELAQPKTYPTSQSFGLSGTMDLPPELAGFATMQAAAPRFSGEPQTTVRLTAKAPNEAVQLAPGAALHLVTPELPAGMPLGAVRLDLDLTGVPAGNQVIMIVNDPLNRRQELLRIGVRQPAPGHVRVLLDFPDQIIPAHERIVYRLGREHAGNLAAVPASANVPFHKLMDDLHKARADLDDARGKAANAKERQEAYQFYKLAEDATFSQMRKLIADPPQTPVRGRRLWLTIVSEHGGTLGAGSRVELLEAEPAAALKEYIPWRLQLFRGQFGVYSESRPWAGIWFENSFPEFCATDKGKQRGAPVIEEVTETSYELHALAPDDDEITQYWRWLHLAWLPGFEPGNIPQPGLPRRDVPQWAQLLDRNLQLYRTIVTWWLDHRHASNGEFGGSVNDDSCLVPWWTGLALIDSQMAPRVRAAHEGVMNNALQYTLDRGIGVRPTDYGHGYEEGVNQESYMPVLLYGNPQAVEQVMRASKSLEAVTFLTPEGKRIFKPHDPKHTWSSKLIDEPLPDDPDWWKTAWPKGTPPSGVNFHPMFILAWYNHDPHAIEVLSQVPGFGGGYNCGGQYAYWLYRLTGDRNLLPRKPFDDHHRVTAGELGGGLDVLLYAWRDDPEFAASARLPWQFKDKPLLNWVMNRDQADLERALAETLWGDSPKSAMGGMEKYTTLYTDAEQHDDRLFLPIEVLSQAYLGGFMVRNKYFPAFAVSWEGFGASHGQCFAGLVVDQGVDHLTVAAVNLQDRPVHGTMRVWQLEHGRYELTQGPDADNDLAADSITRREELELARMDGISIDLEPAQVQILTLRQTGKLAPVWERGDLAIGAPDIVRDGDTWKITVHNIGSRPTQPATVALMAGDKTLATAELPALAAPVDFTPSTITVSLPAAAGATAVVLNPDARFPELTRLNNRLDLP